MEISLEKSAKRDEGNSTGKLDENIKDYDLTVSYPEMCNIINVCQWKRFIESTTSCLFFLTINGESSDQFRTSRSFSFPACAQDRIDFALCEGLKDQRKTLARHWIRLHDKQRYQEEMKFWTYWRCYFQHNHSTILSVNTKSDLTLTFIHIAANLLRIVPWGAYSSLCRKLQY